MVTEVHTYSQYISFEQIFVMLSDVFFLLFLPLIFVNMHGTYNAITLYVKICSNHWSSHVSQIHFFFLCGRWKKSMVTSSAQTCVAILDLLIGVNFRLVQSHTVRPLFPLLHLDGKKKDRVVTALYDYCSQNPHFWDFICVASDWC